MKKLGFGLMRLPSLENGEIDIETVKKMVDIFIERGFTYFDTAWMYCSFKSEDAVKEILTKRYPRDAFTLATKLHHLYINSKEDRDKVFSEQKRKTGVDFFDYYLIHDMGDESYKKYTELDCFNWLFEKKRTGLVKKAGFSHHGTPELLDKVLTGHPEFDFVQLQINYLDWESDNVQSRRCYEVAAAHGKKVVVMEPVKGGMLAKVPFAVKSALEEYAPNATPASWAIRFAASLENVAVVLSGMSTVEQISENTDFMSELIPLSNREKEILERAASMIRADITVACTGCSYCTDGCPAGIPIPDYFSLYNSDCKESLSEGDTPVSSYYKTLAERRAAPTECLECGQCENICPQHLDIIKYLKDVANHFAKNKNKFR